MKEEIQKLIAKYEENLQYLKSWGCWTEEEELRLDTHKEILENVISELKDLLIENKVQ